jgi:VWFA-related protein
MKKLLTFLLCSSFVLLSLNHSSLAQTPERKKKKIKNFGSSLKRKSNVNATQKIEKVKNSEDSEIIIKTDLVVLDCLVTDAKGNVITDLKAQDFVISEDNQAQEIEMFSLGNDAKVPRSIVLVIDYSGSQKPYIERSVEAAKLLVDKLRPNDLMAIVTDDVELIAQFTSDKAKLKKELDELKKTGGVKVFGIGSFNIGKSKQFSALYATLNEIFDETDVRPIVIFQTDGDELLFLNDQYGNEIYPNINRQANFSSVELFELANKSRASLYSIFVGAKYLGLSEEEKKKKREAENLRWYKYWGFDPTKIPPPTPEQEEERRQLQARIKQYYPNGLPDPQEFMSNLSQQTGGWIEFLEEPEQADGIYTRILSELNTRYIIGYIPTNETKDGKRRAVKVEIKNHPEYKVFGKTSYIAPLPD